jgi:hypothetical protein
MQEPTTRTAGHTDPMLAPEEHDSHEAFKQRHNVTPRMLAIAFFLGALGIATLFSYSHAP